MHHQVTSVWNLQADKCWLASYCVKQVPSLCSLFSQYPEEMKKKSTSCLGWKPLPCNQFPCTAALCLTNVFLLQVELLRTKRGTRFYRGEPDWQPARRTLLIVHVEKSSPSFDPSCEPHHSSVCLSLHHHPHHHHHSLMSLLSFMCLCSFLLYICNRFCMWQWLSFVCVLAEYTYCWCLCLCVCVGVFSVHCLDSETSAVRSYGDTWLRWRGQRVEYCRCALRGRERCHIVPVISECDMDAYTHKQTRGFLTFLLSCLIPFGNFWFATWRIFFCVFIFCVNRLACPCWPVPLSL